MWKRNTNGLREASLKKRAEATLKVEEAIQTLIREEKPINFNAVTTISGVSKSWLYKQTELRQRIEALRAQTKSAAKPKYKTESASDKSKDTMITALREQLKQLKAENKALDQQLAIAYGLSSEYEVQSLQQENRRLTEELQRTQKLLDEAIKAHQSTLEQNQRLRRYRHEVQALRSGLDDFEREVTDLKKQNAYLMTLLQRAESAERAKAAKDFRKAIGQTDSIPDVEY